MWLCREPVLNYWLFERQTSFGMSSEMCEWVLAKPNGEYILSYQPAEMNTPNSLEIQKLEFYDESGFPEFWEPTGEVKTFGDTIHGWDSYEGEKYEVHFKGQPDPRSEEHTSELQSRGHLVCRLLLEKKKQEKN